MTAVATNDSISAGTVLLERLRQWVSPRRRPNDLPDDEPPRRGLAISTCVLIAVVLWFTLSLGETYPDTLEIPTQVVNLPDDVALSERLPETIQVQVRGEGIELFRLRFDPPAIQIDGQQDEVSLEDQVLELPKGVELDGISPRVLRLRKEPRQAKRIPIVFNGRIEPATTFDLLHPPRLDPDSILVSGARSIIARLDAWPTEYLRIDGLKDSLVTTLPLADTLGALVNRGAIATTLTVVARPFTQGERLMEVRVTGGVTEAGRIVTLDPATVRVKYNVPLSQYEAAQTARDFFATVSYETIRNDTTGIVRPQLHLPAGLTLVNVEVTPSRLRYYERLMDQ